MTETILHVRGARVVLTATQIKVQVPKGTKARDAIQMSDAAVQYLVEEAFIMGPKTREVLVERVLE